MHLETFTSPIVVSYKEIYTRIKAIQSLGEQKVWLGVMQSTEKRAKMFDCTFDWKNKELFSGAC